MMNKYIEEQLKKIIEDPKTSNHERISALKVMNDMIQEAKSKRDPYRQPWTSMFAR